LIKSQSFQGAFRGEFGQEVRLEGLELFALVFADDEVAGSQAVLESVLGGVGFAFFGARGRRRSATHERIRSKTGL
jgi:hypothetical protein